MEETKMGKDIKITEMNKEEFIIFKALNSDFNIHTISTEEFKKFLETQAELKKEDFDKTMEYLSTMKKIVEGLEEGKYKR